MDIFDEEIIKFFNALNQNHVQYIVVGGLATNLHGYDRYTGDIDVWLKDTLENRQHLRKAFIDSGMPDHAMVETMQFVPGWTDFRLNNGLRLDIMTEMKGIGDYTFEQSQEIAAIADLSEITIPFLHISQLISNKKAVDRPKDQLDVIALEKLQQMQEKQAGRDNSDNDHGDDYEPWSNSR